MTADKTRPPKCLLPIRGKLQTGTAIVIYNDSAILPICLVLGAMIAGGEC